MNPRKLKKRITLIASLLGALVLTVSISPRLFIANTPQLNPDFIADLQQAPSDFVAFIQNPFAPRETAEGVRMAELEVVDTPEGVNFTPIARGVYAAEDTTTGQSYVKIDQGTQLEVHTVTLEDGRTVTVYVPLE